MVTESYKKIHFNSSLGADTTVVIIIIIIIIIINIIIWSSSSSSSWIESSSSSCDHHHQCRHHHDYRHCYMHYHNVLILKFIVIANVIVIKTSESLSITIIIILAVHCTCLKRAKVLSVMSLSFCCSICQTTNRKIYVQWNLHKRNLYVTLVLGVKNYILFAL